MNQNLKLEPTSIVLKPTLGWARGL